MLKDSHPLTSAIMASPKAKQSSRRPITRKPRTKEIAPIFSISHLFFRGVEDEREVAQRFAPIRGDGRHAEQVQGEDLTHKHKMLRAQETARQHHEQARGPGYRGASGGDQRCLPRWDPS